MDRGSEGNREYTRRQARERGKGGKERAKRGRAVLKQLCCWPSGVRDMLLLPLPNWEQFSAVILFFSSFFCVYKLMMC